MKEHDQEASLKTALVSQPKLPSLTSRIYESLHSGVDNLYVPGGDFITNLGQTREFIGSLGALMFFFAPIIGSIGHAASDSPQWKSDTPLNLSRDSMLVALFPVLLLAIGAVYCRAKLETWTAIKAPPSIMPSYQTTPAVSRNTTQQMVIFPEDNPLPNIVPTYLSMWSQAMLISYTAREIAGLISLYFEIIDLFTQDFIEQMICYSAFISVASFASYPRYRACKNTLLQLANNIDQSIHALNAKADAHTTFSVIAEAPAIFLLTTIGFIQIIDPLFDILGIPTPKSVVFFHNPISAHGLFIASLRGCAMAAGTTMTQFIINMNNQVPEAVDALVQLRKMAEKPKAPAAGCLPFHFSINISTLKALGWFVKRTLGEEEEKIVLKIAKDLKALPCYQRWLISFRWSAKSSECLVPWLYAIDLCTSLPPLAQIALNLFSIFVIGRILSLSDLRHTIQSYKEYNQRHPEHESSYESFSSCVESISNMVCQNLHHWLACCSSKNKENTVVPSSNSYGRFLSACCPSAQEDTVETMQASFSTAHEV